MTVWSKDRLAMLAEITAANPTRRVVVIGAVAVAHHLGPSFRSTLDLDLCIASPVEELRAPPSWNQDVNSAHRWRTAQGLVDLVAAGEVDLARGFVGWPDGTRLSLGGIDIALRDATPIEHDLPETVGVASLRALFLCKAMAWLERGWERRKDLGDLAHILDRYVDPDDPRCFEQQGIPPDVDLDEVPAFLLGDDLARVCESKHLASLTRFVVEVRDDRRPPHSVMSAHWPRDPLALTRRLAAFQRGAFGAP